MNDKALMELRDLKQEMLARMDKVSDRIENIATSTARMDERITNSTSCINQLHKEVYGEEGEQGKGLKERLAQTEVKASKAQDTASEAHKIAVGGAILGAGGLGISAGRFGPVWESISKFLFGGV